MCSVKEVAEKGTDLQNALKRVRAYPRFVINFRSGPARRAASYYLWGNVLSSA